jgi:hypothetical protein
MRLIPYPGHHVRVMQFEGRSLGTDPGQFGEVVPGSGHEAAHSSELP